MKALRFLGRLLYRLAYLAIALILAYTLGGALIL